MLPTASGRSTRRKALTTNTLTIKYLTSTGLESNPGILSDSPKFILHLTINTILLLTNQCCFGQIIAVLMRESRETNTWTCSKCRIFFPPPWMLTRYIHQPLLTDTVKTNKHIDRSQIFATHTSSLPYAVNPHLSVSLSVCLSFITPHNVYTSSSHLN